MVSLDIRQHKPPNPWWVGAVCGMASYIDSTAIVANGIALVIYQKVFGLSGAEFGVMSGALTLCIAVGALVGGRLGDRLGRRHVFITTMATIVCGATLLTFGTEFVILLPGIMLVGLGTGADLPVSLATISEAANGKNRGAIIGLSNTLWTVGILAATAIGAIAGDWGRLGGQVLYGHVAVIALIVLMGRITIPESRSWSEARAERLAGKATIRAVNVSYRDLFKGSYLVPVIALMSFYALINLAANTGGQFGTYCAVNIAGLSVELNSRLSLLTFPFSICAGVLFMRIVDTKRRMPFYVFGGVLMAASDLVPAVFGFNLWTIIIMSFLGGIGGAFCFEGILKVWTQESFPTMLRSTAQGMIVAVARVLCGLLAFVTPALFDLSARGLYGSLAVLVTVGLVIGWVTFHSKKKTIFDVEEELDPEAAFDSSSQPVAVPKASSSQHTRV